MTKIVLWLYCAIFSTVVTTAALSFAYHEMNQPDSVQFFFGCSIVLLTLTVNVVVWFGVFRHQLLKLQKGQNDEGAKQV